MTAPSIRSAVLLPPLFLETIVTVNFALGHKRALLDAFDMKLGFKYYRYPVIDNSAREAL
jgi:hypothetical protein